MKEDASTRAHYARYARISHVLDRAFRVPGTKWRFGMDALIGFVPGIGDLVGAVLGIYGVFVARRLGVPLSVQSRMVGNVFMDTVTGTVPVVGDAVDFAYKPHVRNLKLIDDWQVAPKKVEHRSTLMLWLIPLSLVGIALLALAIATLGIVAMMRLIS